MNDNVIIGHIGANGYGIYKTPYDFVYIPFTLPGECAEITVCGKYATYIVLKEKSPERVDAHCQHFGECGGCTLQHWRSDAYRVWKRQLVVDALKKYGLNSVVSPLIEC